MDFSFLECYLYLNTVENHYNFLIQMERKKLEYLMILGRLISFVDRIFYYCQSLMNYFVYWVIFDNFFKICFLFSKSMQFLKNFHLLLQISSALEIVKTIMLRNHLNHNYTNRNPLFLILFYLYFQTLFLIFLYS